MNPFSLTQLADHDLRKELISLESARFASDAHALARFAEFDARELFLAEGYPSMRDFCMGVLKHSEDEAITRRRIARAAHAFPAIYPMLQDRRLSPTAVVRLRPRLTKENAEELLGAAAGKTIAQLELLLAERFPRPDLATRVRVIAPSDEAGELCLGGIAGADALQGPGPACGEFIQLVSKPLVGSVRRSRVTPLSLHRFGLEFTIGQEAHDLLVEAQSLLGHAVPSGDVGEVFLRAMRTFVERLKKQRFAATSKPRPGRISRSARHIPAEVKRAVLARDGERCAFVSDKGHRCEERAGLEFDHVIPIAKGGATTPDNLRVLCRPHNQHAADRVYGRGFMDAKREEVKRQAAELRAQKAAAALAKAQAKAAEDAELEAAGDVLPGLKHLGCSRDELRAAAARLATIPDAPLAERMRFALKGLCPTGVTRTSYVARAPA